MSKRPPTPSKPWTPMEPAAWIPPADPELLRIHLEHLDGEAPEMWMNDRYVASVQRRDDGTIHCLSIRHADRRKAVHDWRHLQWIKNDIAGPEIEAVELYPAESRLMDTANQFWLWCSRPGQRLPVGFDLAAPAVSDHDEASAYGAAQRNPV